VLQVLHCIRLRRLVAQMAEAVRALELEQPLVQVRSPEQEQLLEGAQALESARQSARVPVQEPVLPMVEVLGAIPPLELRTREPLGFPLPASLRSLAQWERSLSRHSRPPPIDYQA
jgi:hypothetical protein